MTDQWRRRPRSWTSEDMEILRREYALGTSIEKIGELLGKTADACQRKAIVNKMPRGFCPRKPRRRTKLKIIYPTTVWTDDLIDILRTGYAEGRHVHAIANMIGCSPSAVTGKAYRLGLVHQGRKDHGWGFNPNASRYRNFSSRRIA